MRLRYPSSIFSPDSLHSESSNTCDQVPEGNPLHQITQVPDSSPDVHSILSNVPCFLTFIVHSWSIFSGENLCHSSEFSFLTLSSLWDWSLLSKHLSYFLLRSFALLVRESILDLSSLHVFSVCLIFLAWKSNSTFLSTGIWEWRWWP